MRYKTTGVKIIKICIACHRGGLAEMLETQREISVGDFLRIVNQYQWYCYDDRIKAYRMLIRRMEKNYKKQRDWLLIYVDSECSSDMEKLFR